MKKKVLLILPPFERFMEYSRYYTHPGLLSLGAVIKSAGYDVLIYDADYDPEGKSYHPLERLEKYNAYLKGLKNPDHKIWQEISELIHGYCPDYLGISVVSSVLKSAQIIVDLAKKICPDIVTISGGVHATFHPEDCLSFTDFVVCHEGEGVIEGILSGNYKKGIIHGKRIINLDKLPLPAYDSLYNLKNYQKRDLSLVVSCRGCPHSCKFCCSPAIWGRKVIRKSVNSFITEITFLKNKYNIHDFFIADDSFSCNKKWLFDFMDKVKKINVTWRCLTRVDFINEEIIVHMVNSGCRNIKIGIESGSQRILDMINKKITIKNILLFNELMQKKNINWSAFFMIGFPGETEEDIMLTMELIKKLSARSITVSIFTPYPGAVLYNSKQMDYEYYSPHSPYNNFTGTIDNKRFMQLVKEVTKAAYTGYIEHLEGQ